MMLNKQFVSIIIPIYNMEGTIGACLESVLNQTYTNFEIIIIDDGSTDNSALIVEKLCKVNSKINYFNQTNAGVSKARNKGIELSNANWLLFIDADDTIAPNYLANIFTRLKPQDDIAIIGLTKVFDNGSRLKVNVPKVGEIQTADFFSDFAYQQQKNGIYGFVATKLIKSTIVKGNNIRFNEELKLAEDLDFFIQYYKHCKQFKFIDECGYFYSQPSEKSLKSSNEVNYIQLIEIYCSLEKLLQSVGFFNNSNKQIISKVKSELKFAYFNEMNDITKNNIEIGFNSLFAIDLLKNNRRSDRILRWLIINKLNYLLLIYLKIRQTYINFKQNK